MKTQDMIFVFGSNTGGIHGAGAAWAALQHHGAAFGVGYGLTGHSFAIPTKGVIKTSRGLDVGHTLPMTAIASYVDGFLQFAADRPDLQFQVTRIGCGLAGLKDEDVAPLFSFATHNCLFDEKWKHLMHDKARYWGSF